MNQREVSYLEFRTMPEKFQKRQIAYKVKISDILNGTYIREEGWTPNYIKTADGRQLSRINIFGTVLAIEEDINFQSVIIDDGSGRIPIRTFEKQTPLNLEIGDIVLVIGRPREYAAQRYILLEITKKIKNPQWLKLRGLELETTPKQTKPKQEEKKQEKVVTEEIIIDSTSDKVLEFIKTNDKGDGIPYEKILNIAKDEKLIDGLLKQGEIFEIKPGYLKILE